MTPREFDASVVQARLALMRELIGDLEGIGGVSAESLSSDRMLRHAVERIISQLVELAVSINSHVASTVLRRAATDYRASFDLATEAGLIDEDLRDRLAPSVGLRNVLAHEYVAIDLSVVAEAVDRAVIDYGDYVSSAASWLASV